MTVQIKRTYLDFVVRDYTSNYPQIELVAGSPGAAEDSKVVPLAHSRDKKSSSFTLRCYLSLQGEDSPRASNPEAGSAATPSESSWQMVYRYDWAFGITLIEKFYWDWLNALPRDGALAIHMILEPDPFEDGPESVPVSAVLSVLRPSRNTESFIDKMLPTILKGTAGISKLGGHTLPPLDYLSGALTMGANILESSSGSRKNWFLYQFLDEKLKCPVVEWRINKDVLKEYGPLIRGTLFLAFPRTTKASRGTLRIQLRPQIRYFKDDEIAYIIPTKEMKGGNPVFIEVRTG